MENILIDIRNESEQLKRIFYNKDLVTIDSLLNKIEELEDEVNELESKIREMEEYYEDNFKRIPMGEQVGVSDRDFI